MAEDTQTVRFDPTNSFDVLQRLGGATDRLGASGARVGEGFIRGERVIRTASANIASSLLSSGDAAQTLLVAMSGLERVFKIGILPTIGVAAGVAIFEVFHRQIERTEKAYQGLREELRKPIEAQVNLSPENLVSDIDALNTKMVDLRKETESTTTKILKFFGAGQGFGGSVGSLKAGIPPTIPEQFGTEKEKALVSAEDKLSKLSAARADQELKIANLKLIDNDLTKAELVLEQKRAALVEESVTKGGNTLNLYKRLLAAQIDVEVAARKKAKEDEKTLDAAKKTTAELEKQNALLKAAPQTSEQKKAQEIQESDQAVANARAEQQRIEDQQAEEKRAAAQKKSDEGEVQRFGRVLSPQERQQIRNEDEGAARQKKFEDDSEQRRQDLRDRMEEQLRGISPEQLKNERDFNKKRGKQDISDLADKDFSGIASLANQDFSGIASLGGLSISIA